MTTNASNGVGSTSQTTLGTISTGTWGSSATKIALASGGTNAAITAVAGGVTYSTASALALTAAGSAGQVLLSGGTGAPTWSTPTFPATVGAAGTILRSDGTNYVASTATFANTYGASQLLYSNGANTVAGLATANNSVLITSGAGVPSISATLPTAVQGNITSTGTIASGVWNGTAVTVGFGGTGDTTLNAYGVLTGGTTSTGAIQSLNSTGTSGQVLTSNGASALPTWQAPASPAAGAAKFWLEYDYSGASILASYNVASVSKDAGNGRITITFTTPFSSSNYAVLASGNAASTSMAIDNPTTTSVRVTAQSSSVIYAVGFGTQ